MRFGFSRQVVLLLKRQVFWQPNGDSNQFRKGADRNRKDHQSGLDRRDFFRAAHRYCSQKWASTGKKRISLYLLEMINKLLLTLRDQQSRFEIVFWFRIICKWYFLASLSMQDFTRWRRRLFVSIVKWTECWVLARNHCYYDVFKKFERRGTSEVELYSLRWLYRALLLRELWQPTADSFVERAEQDCVRVCALDGRNHWNR